MLNRRLRERATLIEMYWSTVRRQRMCEPPPGLDTETAQLIVQLERYLSASDTSAAFVDDLWQRIATTPEPTTSRAWRVPAFDPERQRRITSRSRDAGEEQHIMADHSPAHPEPLSLPRKRWTRELLKLAAAAVIFMIVGAVLALTLRDDSSDVPGVAPGATPTVTIPAATPDAPQATATGGSTATASVASSTIDRASTAAIARTATAEETVAAQATADASLPGPGTVIAAIPVGAVPEGHVFATGSLWVSNIEDQTISRIDAATNTVVATIPVGSPTDHPAMVAAWGDEIWVLNPVDRTLMRIDPATNTIATTIAIGEGADPVNDPQRLAVSDGAIWVSDTLSYRVVRIDPQTQSVVASIEGIGTPHSIGATADGIWVASVINEQILRIDPATNEVVARIGTPDLGLNSVYVAGNEVWAGGPSVIVRIDPATNAIAESISLPEPIFFDYGGFIAVGDGSIWFAATPEVTLYRIDIATQSVAAVLRSDAITNVADLSAIYADGSLWLTGIEANMVTRVAPTP